MTKKLPVTEKEMIDAVAKIVYWVEITKVPIFTRKLVTDTISWNQVPPAPAGRPRVADITLIRCMARVRLWTEATQLSSGIYALDIGKLIWNQTNVDISFPGMNIYITPTIKP